MNKLTILALILLLNYSCLSNQNDKTELAFNEDKTELKASIKRGENVYKDMCITCHLADGKGVPKVFPPLANSDYLREKQIESIKNIKYGVSGKMIVNGINYNGSMTPMGLSNEEIADVMNYINNSWGNNIENIVTAEKVSKL